MQQEFDFSSVGFRMLSANAFTRDFARQLVQLQRDGQALLSSHCAVALDLFCRCGGGVHEISIRRRSGSHNIQSSQSC